MTKRRSLPEQLEFSFETPHSPSNVLIFPPVRSRGAIRAAARNLLTVSPAGRKQMLMIWSVTYRIRHRQMGASDANVLAAGEEYERAVIEAVERERARAIIFGDASVDIDLWGESDKAGDAG